MVVQPDVEVDLLVVADLALALLRLLVDVVLQDVVRGGDLLRHDGVRAGGARHLDRHLRLAVRDGVVGRLPRLEVVASVGSQGHRKVDLLIETHLRLSEHGFRFCLRNGREVPCKRGGLLTDDIRPAVV